MENKDSDKKLRMKKDKRQKKYQVVEKIYL